MCISWIKTMNNKKKKTSPDFPLGHQWLLQTFHLASSDFSRLSTRPPVTSPDFPLGLQWLLQTFHSATSDFSRLSTWPPVTSPDFPLGHQWLLQTNSKVEISISRSCTEIVIRGGLRCWDKGKCDEIKKYFFKKIKYTYIFLKKLNLGGQRACCSPPPFPPQPPSP